jgi:hypothetical protein
MAQSLVSSIPARSKKSVSVGPGISAVTMTPVSRNSWRTASAKEYRNAFEAAYVAWYGPGAVAAIEEVNSTRPPPRVCDLVVLGHDQQIEAVTREFASELTPDSTGSTGHDRQGAGMLTHLVHPLRCVARRGDDTIA